MHLAYVGLLIAAQPLIKPAPPPPPPPKAELAAPDEKILQDAHLGTDGLPPLRPRRPRRDRPRIRSRRPRAARRQVRPRPGQGADRRRPRPPVQRRRCAVPGRRHRGPLRRPPAPEGPQADRPPAGNA